ncbi:ABC transporter permease [Streptomyces sp. BI20]|uniref:ABC transporter permease n=1 Tax=Streptomyces sp. BI20 TaxID=3403460 RepID=UPI003C7549D3
MAEAVAVRAVGGGGEDPAGSGRGMAVPGFGVWARAAAGVRGYLLIAGMWVRATMAYRASFVLTVAGNAAVTGLDFVGIWIMFTHVEALGGFSLPEVALLYGLSSTAFGLTDLVVGNSDRVGQRVRDGSLDVMLTRPVPVLAQVAADRFALRRVGRLVQGVPVLAWGLAASPVVWTVDRVLLVPVAVVAGAALFAAVFVAGAAFQFVAGEAAEAQNAFTYGGTALLRYPPTVFAREVVWAVTCVVPLAFVNWWPVLYLLDRPNPLGLPGWVAWCGPVVAALVLAPVSWAWRSGLRAYRGTGS